MTRLPNTPGPPAATTNSMTTTTTDTMPSEPAAVAGTLAPPRQSQVVSTTLLLPMVSTTMSSRLRLTTPTSKRVMACMSTRKTLPSRTPDPRPHVHCLPNASVETGLRQPDLEEGVDNEEEDKTAFKLLPVAAPQDNPPRTKRGKRTRQWSAEEKKTRRKLQCRMNQRRYRARQRGLTMVLTLETRRLQDHVKELDWYLQFLREVAQVPGAITSDPDHTTTNNHHHHNVLRLPRAIRIVHEFFRLFEYGFAHESHETSEIQKMFLEFIMDPQLIAQGATEKGLEAMMLQLKRYTSYHATFRMCMESLDPVPWPGTFPGSSSCSRSSLVDGAGFGRPTEWFIEQTDRNVVENTRPMPQDNGSPINDDTDQASSDDNKPTMPATGTATATTASTASVAATTTTATLVVYVRGKLLVRISRDTILLVFPHVMENERICERLVGQDLSPEFTMGFHFNAHTHKVAKWDFFVDFTKAFLDLLHDVEQVNTLMNRAQISPFSELGLGPLKPVDKAATSEQLQLKYILL